jgi:hypothetical protein
MADALLPSQQGNPLIQIVQPQQQASTPSSQTSSNQSTPSAPQATDLATSIEQARVDATAKPLSYEQVVLQQYWGTPQAAREYQNYLANFEANRSVAAGGPDPRVSRGPEQTAPDLSPGHYDQSKVIDQSMFATPAPPPQPQTPSGVGFNPEAIINETEREQAYLKLYGEPVQQTITINRLLGAPAGAVTGAPAGQRYYPSNAAIVASGAAQSFSSLYEGAGIYKQNTDGSYEVSINPNLALTGPGGPKEIAEFQRGVRELAGVYPVDVKQVSPTSFLISPKAASAPSPVLYGPPTPKAPMIASGSLADQWGTITLPVVKTDISGNVIANAPLSTYNPNEPLSMTNAPPPGTVLSLSGTSKTVASGYTVKDGQLVLNTVTTTKTEQTPFAGLELTDITKPSIVAPALSVVGQTGKLATNEPPSSSFSMTPTQTKYATLSFEPSYITEPVLATDNTYAGIRLTSTSAAELGAAANGVAVGELFFPQNAVEAAKASVYARESPTTPGLIAKYTANVPITYGQLAGIETAEAAKERMKQIDSTLNGNPLSEASAGLAKLGVGTLYGVGGAAYRASNLVAQGQMGVVNLVNPAISEKQYAQEAAQYAYEVTPTAPGSLGQQAVTIELGVIGFGLAGKAVGAASAATGVSASLVEKAVLGGTSVLVGAPYGQTDKGFNVFQAAGASAGALAGMTLLTSATRQPAPEKDLRPSPSYGELAEAPNVKITDKQTAIAKFVDPGPGEAIPRGYQIVEYEGFSPTSTELKTGKLLYNLQNPDYASLVGEMTDGGKTQNIIGLVQPAEKISLVPSEGFRFINEEIPTISYPTTKAYGASSAGTLGANVISTGKPIATEYAVGEAVPGSEITNLFSNKINRYAPINVPDNYNQQLLSGSPYAVSTPTSAQIFNLDDYYIGRSQTTTANPSKTVGLVKDMTELVGPEGKFGQLYTVDSTTGQPGGNIAGSKSFVILIENIEKAPSGFGQPTYGEALSGVRSVDYGFKPVDVTAPMVNQITRESLTSIDYGFKPVDVTAPSVGKGTQILTGSAVNDAGAGTVQVVEQGGSGVQLTKQQGASIAAGVTAQLNLQQVVPPQTANIGSLPIFGAAIGQTQEVTTQQQRPLYQLGSVSQPSYPQQPQTVSQTTTTQGRVQIPSLEITTQQPLQEYQRGVALTTIPSTTNAVLTLTKPISSSQTRQLESVQTKTSELQNIKDMQSTEVKLAEIQATAELNKQVTSQLQKTVSITTTTTPRTPLPPPTPLIGLPVAFAPQFSFKLKHRTTGRISPVKRPRVGVYPDMLSELITEIQYGPGSTLAVNPSKNPNIFRVAQNAFGRTPTAQQYYGTPKPKRTQFSGLGGLLGGIGRRIKKK